VSPARHNVDQVDADLRRVAEAADSLVRSAQDLRGALDGLSESVRAAIREAEEVTASPTPVNAVASTPVPATSPAAQPVEPVADVPEGARIVALNMVLDGKPRNEVAAQLQDEFGLSDTDALLDDVFARVG
jgi:hypothetical protein